MGGAKVSYIGSLDGLAGALTDTPRAEAFYSYESVSVSTGLSEGAEGVIGLFVSTDTPLGVAGTELFATLEVDLGAGVGAELLTDPLARSKSPAFSVN